MNLEEIKKEAIGYKSADLKSLSNKILELKNQGIAFLGCVYFVQINQAISLKEARALTLKLDVYSNGEKKVIDDMNQQMLSEYEEE